MNWTSSATGGTHSTGEATAGGTRILFHRFAPDSSAPEPPGDPAAQAAEVAEKLPGPRLLTARRGSRHFNC